MGFIDKLKNIFFEEEEDEEIEDTLPPKNEIREKKEKKEKKEKTEIVEKEVEKQEVIAKKVEIPKEEKEVKVEKSVIEKQSVKPEKEHRVNKINTELIFDDDDFIFDNKVQPKKEESTNKSKIIKSYRVQEKKEETFDSKKYEVKKPSYVSPSKTSAKNWTPSPIISPIYGILDKNYKKEEVKENKEIRLSSRPSRMDFDSVRNKAFGDLEYDLFDNMKEDKESYEKEIPEDKEQHKKNKSEVTRVHKNDDETKPVIDKVTLGEADEFYNDLGLAYNTDYKDLSKDLNDGKVDSDKKGKKKDKLEDNLFDLIESMYDRED